MALERQYHGDSKGLSLPKHSVFSAYTRRHGCALRREGYSALHWAAKAGQVAVIEILVKSKATVNLPGGTDK
jgi:hypothetical protein